MSNTEVGDKFQVEKLRNQSSEIIDLGEVVGNTPCIILFYPKDFTPGCTKEVCSFQENLSDLNDLGIKVIGISSDSESKHKAFARQYNIEFDLLSDPENKFRKKVGVPSDMFGLLPGRVTYMIDDQGIVKDIVQSQLKIDMHLKKALEFAAQFKTA